MATEIVPYGGWQKVLRLANKQTELLLTTEVGPRIIRFGFTGGPNEFAEYPDQMGKTGGSEYRSYGGHRFWIAPEHSGRTNHPDNGVVGWKEERGEVTLIAPVETGTQLQKHVRVQLDADRNHARITHRVTNRGKQIVQLAPWGISVMAPGGYAIIPQERYIPHAERVLPVRPMTLWGYTEMADPRWTWGNRYIQLRQDRSSASVQKFGMFVSQGWAAYANGDRLFLKRFPCDANAGYPDFGCNAEFFSNQRMLEVESLGPLTALKPGESVSHQEDWYLFRDVHPGTTDQAIETAMTPLLVAAGF